LIWELRGRDFSSFFDPEQSSVKSSLALAAVQQRHFAAMSAIVDYLASLPDDAEEVDLSSFELIEYFDDAAWTKLASIKTMKRLKLPPSLATIKKNAFDHHSQLTDVTFPSSLRSIEYRAFAYCSALAMRDFKLPDSLEELGEHAFFNCRGITGR
jgi:hypothetical protein